MFHPALPSVLIASLLSAWCPVVSRRLPEPDWISPVLAGLDSSRRPALELLACRLARELGSPAFRRRVDSALIESGRVAIGIGDRDPGSGAAMASLPIPAHRQAWLRHPAGPRLVAVMLDSLPIAFDPGGGRHHVDPARPPRTPVLVIDSVPALPVPAIQISSPDLPSPLGGGRAPARRATPGSPSPCQESSP